MSESGRLLLHGALGGSVVALMTAVGLHHRRARTGISHQFASGSRVSVARQRRVGILDGMTLSLAKYGPTNEIRTYAFDRLDDVTIGEDCYLGTGVALVQPMAHEDVGVFLEIGHGVVVGQRVIFDGSTDPISSVLAGSFGSGRPIRIENGAWIGAGAVIAAGVSIGRRAIVIPGSVVTEDVAPDSIVGGSPARRF